MTRDPFIAAVESAAQETIARIDAETQQQVAAILAEAKQKAKDEVQRYVDDAQQAANRAAQKKINAARMKSQQAEADACYVLLQEFFVQIGKELEAVRQREDYPEIFDFLLQNAVAGFDGGIVQIDPRDSDVAQKAVQSLESDFEIRQDISTLGGLKAHSADGSVLRDNTFELRLDRVRTERAQEIWSVLTQ
jgi:V/A-type H+-transporting ATPase subunit E